MATGRPKFEITPEVLEKTKKLAGQGLTKEQIARCLGIGRTKLFNMQKDDADFMNAIKEGQAAGIEEISNALFDNAKDGNTTAQIFYLKNRAPDEWKDRREVATEDLDKKKLVEMTDEELEIHRREIMGEPASPTTH